MGSYFIQNLLSPLLPTYTLILPTYTYFNIDIDCDSSLFSSSAFFLSHLFVLYVDVQLVFVRVVKLEELVDQNVETLLRRVYLFLEPSPLLLMNQPMRQT